ncbi:hypothetical protein TgHK011_005059 [Trichoderma gracile]|nr:hypothetical protein TgHK011_005059 [Trichoderma gracile]
MSFNVNVNVRHPRTFHRLQQSLRRLLKHRCAARIWSYRNGQALRTAIGSTASQMLAWELDGRCSLDLTQRVAVGQAPIPELRARGGEQAGNNTNQPARSSQGVNFTASTRLHQLRLSKQAAAITARLLQIRVRCQICRPAIQSVRRHYAPSVQGHPYTGRAVVVYDVRNTAEMTGRSVQVDGKTASAHARTRQGAEKKLLTMKRAFVSLEVDSTPRHPCHQPPDPAFPGTGPEKKFSFSSVALRSEGGTTAHAETFCVIEYASFSCGVAAQQNSHDGLSLDAMPTSAHHPSDWRQLPVPHTRIDARTPYCML